MFGTGLTDRLRRAGSIAVQNQKTIQTGGRLKMANSITPEQLKALMGSDRKPAVFDVRRKTDFEAAPEKIGGADWLDPEKTDEWSPEIPDDRPVVVYCVKGGSVSQSIADRLEKNGIDARFLQGGIKAWTDSGETLGE